MNSSQTITGVPYDDETVEHHNTASQMVFIVVLVAFALIFLVWLCEYLYSKRAKRLSRAANNDDVELNDVVPAGRTLDNDTFRELFRSPTPEPPPAYLPRAHLRPEELCIPDSPPQYYSVVLCEPRRSLC